MTQELPLPQAARALPALALLLVAACSQGPQAEEETTTLQAKKREPAKVIVAEVQQRETVRRLETTTRVESEHQVEVFPRASGQLMELFVEEGDAVERDQVLARLDDREARIALADARTTLEEAKANLPKLGLAVREAEARVRASQNAADQAERDHLRNVAIAEGEGGQPGLISRRELDVSQGALDQAIGELETLKLGALRAAVEEQAGHAAVDRAEFAVDRAELDLSYTELTAPFDGVVAERMVNLGGTLTAAAPAFVISDRQNLRAVFFRPQRELGLFRRAMLQAPEDDAPTRAGTDGDGGQALLAIHATAEALPGVVFDGQLERIAPTIDPASGNFRVTARLEVGEPPMTLLPGMLVRLGIVTERHPDALVVPKRAIRREGDRNLIFVIKQNVAHEVVVEEGFPDGDDVEVIALEGELAAGDQVVVVGNRDLEQGAEVTLPAKEPAQEPATDDAPVEPPAAVDEAATETAEPVPGDQE